MRQQLVLILQIRTTKHLSIQHVAFSTAYSILTLKVGNRPIAPLGQWGNMKIRLTVDKEKTIAEKMRVEAERTIGNISTRTERPEQAFWLSFAGEDGFHGAVIVHAEDFLTALMETNLRHINPHGECNGMEIPPERAKLIPDKWKYRILNREQCVEFDKEMTELYG